MGDWGVEGERGRGAGEGEGGRGREGRGLLVVLVVLWWKMERFRPHLLLLEQARTLARGLSAPPSSVGSGGRSNDSDPSFSYMLMVGNGWNLFLLLSTIC